MRQFSLHHPGGRRLLAAAVVVASSFLSCQQEPATGANDAPFAVRQAWKVGNPARYPDSASWTMGTDSSGFDTLRPLAADSFEVAHVFATRVAGRQIFLRLWRLGLRTTSFGALVRDDGSLALDASLPRDTDAVVVGLLSSFDSARERGSFGSASDPLAAKRDSLRGFAASQVLAGTRRLESLPPALDTGAVLADVVLRACRRGTSAMEVSLTTGIDLPRLRAKVCQILLDPNRRGMVDSQAFLHPVPPDTIPPRIVRVAPLADTATVGYGTRSIHLEWTVTDDSLASVSLSSGTLRSDGSVYRADIALAVGIDTFALVAKDKRGNIARDRVRVRRLADASRPAATWTGGSKDTIVTDSVATIHLSWKLDDEALRSVSIAGSSVQGADGVYSRDVAVPADSAWLRLEAADSSGNVVVDSVRVRRLSVPRISPAGASLRAGSVVVAVSCNQPAAVVRWAWDNGEWTEKEPGKDPLATRSGVLRVSAELGGVRTRDSAVFLFDPTLSPPSNGYSAEQLVLARGSGPEIVEDSVSTREGWASDASLPLRANARVFARSRLAGRTSAVVEADYAFPPRIRDTVAAGVAAIAVPVDWDGVVDSVEWSQTGASGPWARLGAGRTVVFSRSGRLYARTRVGVAYSPVDSATVSLVQGAPRIDPPGGAFPAPVTVRLSSSPDGGEIHYTTDGSDPTEASPLYAGPFPVAVTSRIRAIALHKGLRTSEVASAVDTIADTAGGWNPDLAYGIVRDGRGNAYRTIRIGGLDWMAQDLRNPDTTEDDSRWSFSWRAAMALPADCEGDCGVDSVQPYRGVCPEGWRIPTGTDFRSLVEAALAGGTDSAAALARLTSGGREWFSVSPTSQERLVGSNSLGLSLTPQASGGSAGYGGNYGSWQSSTPMLSGTRVQVLLARERGIEVSLSPLKTAIGVRCVR